MFQKIRPCLFDPSEYEVSKKSFDYIIFQGMTDGVAMLTRAKENLMFTMSALSAEQREALSQSKHEFIEMCSFNGHECNIDE